MNVMEDTLVLLKPDCVQRNLVSVVMTRLERNFQILAMKTIWMEEVDVVFLYGKYKDKEFFQALSDFMQSGRCHAVCIRGFNVVERARVEIGATENQGGLDRCGTIRGEYATSVRHNVVHASDSVEASQRELEHFFTLEERQRLGITASDHIT